MTKLNAQAKEAEARIDAAKVQAMSNVRAIAISAAQAATGRLIGDILIREGDYRHAFPEDITGAVRLNGSWSEREMENWGTEMPMTALDSLHVDLEAARYEMSLHSSAKSKTPAAVSTEQAAS